MRNKPFFRSFICAFLILLTLAACAGLGRGSGVPRIESPYSSVDWQSYGQYKTALHVHTTNSDGRSPFNRVVELYYEQDFDLLAITDHNQVTRDWISVRNGLTQERFEEITRGEGRTGRGMQIIPNTNEQTIQLFIPPIINDHVNTFLTNWSWTSGNTIRDILKAVEEQGGLSFINHPGMNATGAAPSVDLVRGEQVANNDFWISRYTDLFMEFSTLGFEIINCFDHVTGSDRIFWDNVLARTIPQGRYVWGFATDDSHRDSEIGKAFSMLLMPENTLENFREAMLSGSFYAVATTARRELGESFEASGPVPRILSIDINEAVGSISINAENYDRIDWIADGKVITNGSTIRLGSHRRAIGSYVRANIIGPGGIVFTQPFGVFW